MIKANFNAYASYVTDSLYQWDLNRVLTVSGLNLPVAPEVHFSNANMDRAIVRQANKVNNVTTVVIPNSLLQSPLPIKVYIGIYEGDEFKVIEKLEIPVIPRKRPMDYQIQNSDEEIYSFNALENYVNNIVNGIDSKYESLEQAYENASNAMDLFEENYGDVVELLQSKANKPTVEAATLIVSGWSGNIYSFEATYPVATYDIEIALNSTATAAQAEAFNSAQIVGSATTNTVKAYGDVPTVDIPIILKAVKR